MGVLDKMELSKVQITGVVTLIAILSGAVTITNIKGVFYCPNEESVRECIRLSSTMKTCYWLDIDLNETRDLCSGGVWQPIANFVKLPISPDKMKFAEINITRPIVMKEAQAFKTIDGVTYVEGNCISTIKII